MFNGNYDDTEVREAVKKIFLEIFNLNLKDHSNPYAIDLVYETHNTSYGVEVERGWWSGNFWSNKKYPYLSGQGFKTINIPIRKKKYWYSDIINNVPNNVRNCFVRTNRDFTQIILINSKTIKNLNKVIFTEFIPGNSEKLEEFMSFRMEDVDTYNLIKNKWIKKK